MGCGTSSNNLNQIVQKEVDQQNEKEKLILDKKENLQKNSPKKQNQNQKIKNQIQLQKNESQILGQQNQVNQEQIQQEINNKVQEVEVIKYEARNIGVQSNEYGYFVMEEIKAENYKGFSLNQVEILGLDEFFEESKKLIKEKKNLVTCLAVGAGKCHLKSIKDIFFTKKEGSFTVIWAKIIEEFENGQSLVCLEDIMFENQDNFKNKGRADLDDLEQAVHKYKQINNESQQDLVASYAEMTKRLFWKNLSQSKIEPISGIQSFLILKKLEHVLRTHNIQTF